MTERPVGEAPRTPERAYGNGYRDGLEAGYRRGREAAAAPPQQRAILDDVLLTLDNEFGEDAPDWAFGLADRVREAAAAPPEPRNPYGIFTEEQIQAMGLPVAAPPEPPRPDPIMADLLEKANDLRYSNEWLGNAFRASLSQLGPEHDAGVAAPEGLSLDVLRRAFFDEYQTSHYGMSKQEAAIRADHIAPRMLARLSPSSGESE